MENINFELYRVFCCVSKSSNITRASHELYISQPAITQTIKKLEKEIGCKLFYRTKKGVELTDDGERLYNYLKNHIECLSIAKEKMVELKNNANKIIRIGSGTTLIETSLIKPLKIFKDLYPHIKVEIEHGTNHDLLNMLSNNLIDIVLMNLPSETNDDIIIEPIEDVIDIFAAKRETFSKYINTNFDMQELSNLPLVLQQESSTARKFLNTVCNKNKIYLKPIYELDSYGLVLNFVKEGLGIGFVNKNHIINELESDELFELKTNLKIPKREIGIAISKKMKNNESINNFIKILKDDKKSLE